MSKLGILLGKLLDMNLSGDEMVTLLEPLSGKTKEEKEQLLEPIIQKLVAERASAPSTPTQTDD